MTREEMIKHKWTAYEKVWYLGRRDEWATECIVEGKKKITDIIEIK